MLTDSSVALVHTTWQKDRPRHPEVGLITSLSFDAGAFGNRLGPRDAGNGVRVKCQCREIIDDRNWPEADMRVCTWYQSAVERKAAVQKV